MASTCQSVLKSCLARFTRLDSCGNPVVGVTSQITTKGYISVGATAQIEAGDEIIQKNACGDLCINFKDCDQFKRYDLELQLCEIDPEALELITNTRLLVDGAGDSIGFANGQTNLCENFSIELWNRLASEDCEVDPDTGEAVQQWYWFAFPYVTNGVLTDMTFENGPLNLTISAFTRSASPTWGRGPNCVLPETAPAESTDHLLAIVTSEPPPEPACGYVELTEDDVNCVAA